LIQQSYICDYQTIYHLQFQKICLSILSKTKDHSPVVETGLYQSCLLSQFDQSDLLLPSAEYYLLGLGHPIMQTYYNLLVNVATLLGAERNRAKREMKELIEFEIELAAVSLVFLFTKGVGWGA
jgi:hypothetical protein